MDGGRFSLPVNKMGTWKGRHIRLLHHITPAELVSASEEVREILLTQDTRACLVASSFGGKSMRVPFLEQALDAGAEKGRLS